MKKIKKLLLFIIFLLIYWNIELQAKSDNSEDETLPTDQALHVIVPSEEELKQQGAFVNQKTGIIQLLPLIPEPSEYEKHRQAYLQVQANGGVPPNEATRKAYIEYLSYLALHRPLEPNVLNSPAGLPILYPDEQIVQNRELSENYKDKVKQFVLSRGNELEHLMAVHLNNIHLGHVDLESGREITAYTMRIFQDLSIALHSTPTEAAKHFMHADKFLRLLALKVKYPDPQLVNAYRNPDAAATKVLTNLVPFSVLTNRPIIAGNIYQSGWYRLSYTKPIIVSQQNKSSLISRPKAVVAIYTTYPQAELFLGDRRLSDNLKIPVYYALPSGTIKKYSPDPMMNGGGEIQILMGPIVDLPPGK